MEGIRRGHGAGACQAMAWIDRISPQAVVEAAWPDTETVATSSSMTTAATSVRRCGPCIAVPAKGSAAAYAIDRMDTDVPALDVLLDEAARARANPLMRRARRF